LEPQGPVQACSGKALPLPLLHPLQAIAKLMIASVDERSERCSSFRSLHYTVELFSVICLRWWLSYAVFNFPSSVTCFFCVGNKKKINHPSNGLDRLRGLQEVVASRVFRKSAHDSGEALNIKYRRLLALPKVPGT
jgi:hypothetical protein